MASQFVSGTYKSYKAGTGKVLHWLYENALKCGYGVEQTEDSAGEGEGDETGTSELKKKSKPKRKSKKGKGSKAKGSGKAKSKKPDASASALNYVGVKEFPALAEAIAAFKPEVKVPLWVTSMIEEVIAGRKKSARWFSRQAGDTTSRDFEESNLGHQHFIEVLENVLSILIGLQEPTSRPAPKKTSDESSLPDRITNLFDALEIEADTEHTMTEPTPSAPKAKKSNLNVVFEEERSMEETLWLVYCFFEDFNIARDHLKDLWTTYRHEAVDLPTVALATNTAFEVFKRAEDELMAELQSTLPPNFRDQMRGYENIERLLHVNSALNMGLSVGSLRSAGDPYNYELWELADWTGLNVYISLKSFLPVIQNDSVPICKPGYFGELNLNEDILNPAQKFTQDQIVLLERLLPEFMFLLDVKDPKTEKNLKFPAEDELTGGILEMIRTKVIPTWLVLALQIQLDIHYILLRDTERPYAELSATTSRAVTSIKNYQNFSKDMQIGLWPKSQDQFLDVCLWEWNFWIISDVLDPPRSATFADVGYPKRGNFVLLKTHPVLCGMMIFSIKLKLHYFGLALVNAWGALPVTLHLYNACLVENLLEKPWIDLEAIILGNTAKRIFVGDRPQTPQDYLRRFMLVMGHSATSFSANRRPNTSLAPASSKGPRQMLAESLIEEVYGDRYRRYFVTRDAQTQNHDATLVAIERLLANSVMDTTTQADSSEKEGRVENFKKQMMQNRPKPAALSKSSKSHKITTLQLLTALEFTMMTESFAFNVDYLALHMRSFQLLRTLISELDPVFTEYFGPRYVEKESQLPFLVGEIFRALVGGPGVGTRVSANTRTDERGRKMLIKVSHIVARFIEKEGEVEVDKVKKACPLFSGLEVEKHFDAPNIDMEALKSMVPAFNALPRKKNVPTGPGPNHWHFSLREVGKRDPPDVVFLINPASVIMHVAVPEKGSPIMSLPTMSDRADMVVSLLLESFVKGLLKGAHAHHAKFAPWTWSCNESALAKVVEEKFRALGLRNELCTVQQGSENDNDCSDEVWTMMRAQIVGNFPR